MDELETTYAGYQQLCKGREEKRVYYDHYRIKVDKLNKKQADIAERGVTSNSTAFKN